MLVTGRSPGGFPLSVAFPAIVVFLLFSFTGSGAQVPADSSLSRPDTIPAGREEAQLPRARIDLEKGGTVIIELFPDDAPVTVARFIELVQSGFYDGLPFHRVESFVVQTGKKDNDYPPIVGEMFDQDLRHEVGTVGMARKPDSYDSGTTQFYIVTEYRSALHGEYTVFGKVVEGMDLVHEIKKNDKITKIEMVE